MVIRLVFLSVSTIWTVKYCQKLGIFKFLFLFRLFVFFTLFIIVLHNGAKTFRWGKRDLWRGIGTENWESADLLLLIKNTVWDGFYKDLYICAEHVLYILLVETIPTYFCWLTWRKQKLVQIKHCSKGYLFWYQDFDSLDRFLSITCRQS